MIVRDEEGNIERALTWGRDIVCEQIVVDTGSTDRTVEIAERMGAKVFHFKWVDDFSAARNFALSKARGNWIAFLDADEYFSDRDAPRLLDILKQLNPIAGCTSVRMPLVNIRDDGQAGEAAVQERVFRNSELKYVGAIHEVLAPAKANGVYRPVMTNAITIIHTGYSKTAYAKTNKLERNVEMLRRELESRPDDPNVMAYLADSLLVRNVRNGSGSYDSLAEIRRLYADSLLEDKPMSNGVKANSYPKFLQLCYEFDRNLYYRAAERAANDFPDIGTFSLHYGIALYLQGNYTRSWEYLRKAEDFLKGDKIMYVKDILDLTSMLFGHLLKCAEARGDEEAMVKYAVLTLREDKSQLGVLGPLIGMFRQSGAGDDAILGILRKIYDFKDPRDVITAAKGAGAAGAEELMNRLKETANSLLDALA
jgi:glycosyltransferase involved in cell wall biosynthesis